MAKFTVTLYSTQLLTGTVEAETSEEAQAKAEAICNSDQVIAFTSKDRTARCVFSKEVDP